MSPALFKANKLLLLEQKNHQLPKRTRLPEEFHQLALPQASYHLRQDDDCDILSQHISAGPFSLWLHDIFAKEDIMILPYTPYHIITLNYMYEDSLQAETRTAGNFPLEERECNLFNLYPGVHKVPMSGDKKILSVHINIQPHVLPQLIARFPRLAFLEKISPNGLSGTINTHPHHINPLCDLLIQKIISCHDTGSRAHYFIQRCCADLFLNFAVQEEDSHQPILFTHLLYMDTYTQLFHYLLDNHHKGQSVAELAYNCFLSTEQLEQGFRQHFSINVVDFLYMLKMMTTYQLLYKSHLDLQDIAETVGFDNVQDMKMHMEAYYNCSLEEIR